MQYQDSFVFQYHYSKSIEVFNGIRPYEPLLKVCFLYYIEKILFSEATDSTPKKTDVRMKKTDVGSLFFLSRKCACRCAKNSGTAFTSDELLSTSEMIIGDDAMMVMKWLISVKIISFILNSFLFCYFIFTFSYIPYIWKPYDEALPCVEAVVFTTRGGKIVFAECGTIYHITWLSRKKKKKKKRNKKHNNNNDNATSSSPTPENQGNKHNTPTHFTKCL